ncbi:MAG TPA: disulfide bond formation protein DsbD [Bacteroidales bacterium]|nr:MAG: disulfide bond formation protein DsbD [Bacteroidetes bacterium GWE2_42_24]OFY31717.1 MAG: disulfide bond formation protein DsbD [Bacteroidetes bacterium GWF2_43_11]PKP27300.1 MAG: disulfide bond formation protein DsbD [Bacteroidetes bacterium HGW-Bacteroidetes-22]HAQ65819.1 disulfide bond formation protein DsbD [Bacteroidales bacterium]HBZ67016.1 disulfide bond formation protein DsbD [Bacteroidales bacterium]
MIYTLLSRSRAALIGVLLLVSSQISAQVLEPVKWSFSVKDETTEEATLVLSASIEKHWHLYSQFIKDGGPIPTSFVIKESDDYKAIGKVKEPKPIQMYDKNFEMDLLYFDGKVNFTQKIKKLTDQPFTITGRLEFMTCDDEKCLPPSEIEYEFRLNSKAGKTATTKVITSPSDEKDSSHPKIETAVIAQDTQRLQTDTSELTATANDSPIDKNASMWGFFWISFLAGLLAILTPCVFPMIPMTVSFFMHDNENKAKARFQATIFGLSIIIIYTLIGTIVALTLGANFANWVSTHWLPNIFFFIIFIIFAASFFGAFELTLPSWIINKSDAQADKGGITGAFFMAFTLVLVSFSCTGPIVGYILVESAGGQILMPIIGMFGFSLAFALPFTIFALFPAWLQSMPKSGGWLNSVKVVLGFIELALGLKFLSIADQTYHWGILDREIYLAIWIVIFALMGFYLLGKLRFPHDDKVEHIGITRLAFSIVTFSFVMYMIPGMWGAPLKGLSGYMPPMTSQDFDFNAVVRDNIKAMPLGTVNANAKTELCEPPKYADFLDLPHGLDGYFDYNQGLACAKATNKPVFIDFTGHGCVNCREMEASVWSNPEVLRRLREKYVVVALYVDDKAEVPQKEWVTSKYDGKVKKTIGKIYADLQISRFNVNAQPYYVLLDGNGDLLVKPRAYDLDVNKFIEFLDAGLKAFEERQKIKPVQ